MWGEGKVCGDGASERKGGGGEEGDRCCGITGGDEGNAPGSDGERGAHLKKGGISRGEGQSEGGKGGETDTAKNFSFFGGGEKKEVRDTDRRSGKRKKEGKKTLNIDHAKGNHCTC